MTCQSKCSSITEALRCPAYGCSSANRIVGINCQNSFRCITFTSIDSLSDIICIGANISKTGGKRRSPTFNRRQYWVCIPFQVAANCLKIGNISSTTKCIIRKRRRRYRSHSNALRNTHTTAINIMCISNCVCACSCNGGIKFVSCNTWARECSTCWITGENDRGVTYPWWNKKIHFLLLSYRNKASWSRLIVKFCFNPPGCFLAQWVSRFVNYSIKVFSSTVTTQVQILGNGTLCGRCCWRGCFYAVNKNTVICTVECIIEIMPGICRRQWIGPYESIATPVPHNNPVWAPYFSETQLHCRSRARPLQDHEILGFIGHCTVNSPRTKRLVIGISSKSRCCVCSKVIIAPVKNSGFLNQTRCTWCAVISKIIVEWSGIDDSVVAKMPYSLITADPCVLWWRICVQGGISVNHTDRSCTGWWQNRNTYPGHNIACYRVVWF